MNTTVDKPWGYYVDFDQGDNWKAKRIEISPDARFSLQSHGYRDEVWVVVSGVAYVSVNDFRKRMGEGEIIRIKARDWHRAQAGPEGCTIIEVQLGVCDERDITRKEDDYGRACD